MEVCLELEQKYKDILVRKFLHHVEAVEADHDVKTDGDNTDYWSSMQLEDGSFVDYNFHMMSEWDDFDRSWTCEVYSVDPPTEDNEYHSINMELTLFLAFYYPEQTKLVIQQ